MPSFEVSAFGETMLRYSVPAGDRLSKLRQLDVHVGGTETNTLAALAGLGRRCAWLSAVADNDLGSFVIRELSAMGIDTTSVCRRAERMGCYYVEFAPVPRPTKVIYDRQDSAVSKLAVHDIAWDVLLDSRILHLTGITPALSQSCAEIVAEAVRRAKAKGVLVSFDVNYRSKLWTAAEARSALWPLIEQVDLLICGEGDAETVFGISGTVNEILTAFQSRSQAKHVILTRSDQGSATLIDQQLTEVPARSAQVIDRLGAGDAFTAGVIDGLLDGDVVAGMQRGSILSALALAEHGDMMISNRQELEQLLESEQTRLQR